MFWTIIMEGEILSLFGPTQMSLCGGKMQKHSNNLTMHLSNTSGRGQIKIRKRFTSGKEKQKKARWCVGRGWRRSIITWRGYGWNNTLFFIGEITHQFSADQKNTTLYNLSRSCVGWGRLGWSKRSVCHCQAPCEVSHNLIYLGHSWREKLRPFLLQHNVVECVNKI